MRDPPWQRMLNAARRPCPFSICSLMLAGILFIWGCGKPSDQKAYEEIVATMAMEKAKRFFDTYPQSPYRNRLVEEIVEWCQREDTEECYRVILQALPKDDRRYQEVVAHYEKRFGEKKVR